VLKRFIQFLLVVLLIPWIIGVTLQIMLLPPITGFWAARYVDVENSAVSRQELLTAADAGRRYVSGGLDEMPRSADERIGFTEQVIAHMQDVRDVFTTVRYLVIILSLVLIAISAWLFRSEHCKLLGQSLRIAAILTLGLVLLLAIIGWLNFDALFTTMHQLFFAEGSWTFAYDSLLITTYPLPFWIAMAATWAAVLVSFCLAALLVGQLMVKRTKQVAKQV
jgi:integral membrane protein (TIGR01906 family)